MKVFEATTQPHLNVAKTLFREYQQFLNVDLCFQGFEQELAGLPGKYASPDGAILLIEYADEIAGCVAVRAIEGDTCEMKRLYVRPEFRGFSLGKTLATEIIEKAKSLNYKKMRLDTLKRLEKAMAIYQQLGFVQIDAYYSNPLDEVVYWQLDLTH